MMTPQLDAARETLLRSNLRDIQAYVRRMEQDRGFYHQNARDVCLRLGEEVGELFRAVRWVDELEWHNPRYDYWRANAAGELADVLIYLCSIATRLDISLAQSLLDKERKNATRSWSRHGDAIDGTLGEFEHVKWPQEET